MGSSIECRLTERKNLMNEEVANFETYYDYQRILTMNSWRLILTKGESHL